MTDLSRRSFLTRVGASAGLAAGSALFTDLLVGSEALAAEPSGPSVDPDAALRRLTRGNRRFVNGNLRHPRRDGVRRAAIAETQTPFAVVLGCADSRVPPEVIYDEGLGDLFVVRTAGNTAADANIVGSVEYAVAILGSAAVVVLGHENCGAVKAAIDVVKNSVQLPGELPAVVAPIVPVVESLMGTVPDAELLDASIRANVANAVAQLSRASLLADAIAGGALQVVGQEYILKSGEAKPVD